MLIWYISATFDIIVLLVIVLKEKPAKAASYKYSICNVNGHDVASQFHRRPRSARGEVPVRASRVVGQPGGVLGEDRREHGVDQEVGQGPGRLQIALHKMVSFLCHVRTCVLHTW